MECIKTVSLDGANRWAPVSVVEAYVDCGTRRLPGEAARSEFRQRLKEIVPRLEQLAQQASRLARQDDQRGDSIGRVLQTGLDAGLAIPDALRLTTQLFQAAAGVAPGFGATLETDEPQVFLLVFAVEVPQLGLACLQAAIELCRHLVQGIPCDVTSLVRQLVDLADDVRLGPSSRAIVRAAAARGIPIRRLNTGSLVQLGEGCHQRRIWTAETDATSAIAESIAQDKELTKRLLSAVGVPVPQGRPVASADDAWVAAQEIGFPVVVKPRRANHARGISLNLTAREQIMAAYEWAVKDGDDTGVLVEQYALGQAHRLLVVGHRLVAAARGESEFVMGDGKRTVRELVDEVNRDPRRGENYTDQLTVLKLDDAALIELEKQGLHPAAIPEAGQRVMIQPVGDLTTDCTAEVHPSNADKAVLAARTVGLDIAGLDVVAQDIRVPLEQQRGAILEVNAGPSLSMHVAPLHGHPQPVGPAIVDLLFPSPAVARIPLLAVGGSGQRAAVARRLQMLLERFRRGVARATSEGVFFQGTRLAAPRAASASWLDTLLIHPDVEYGIWEVVPEHAGKHGLGYERADIALLIDLPATVEDTGGDATREALLRDTCLALAHAVPPDGWLVLPLHTPWTETLLRACRGRRVLFADEPDAGEVERAVRGGCAVLYARGNSVCFARSEGEEAVMVTENDSARRREILAAWAAAWAAGIVPEQLAR